MKKKKNQIKTLYSLGLKYLKQDNLKKSKEIFIRIIKLDKFNSNSYSNIGLIEKRLNNLKESILNYKKAIKINKKNYIAYNNLANIYKEIKLYKKAKEKYLKSIAINPNYLESYINFALLNEEVGDFKSSIKYYKKALELDINNLELYLKLSQFDEGILDFNLEKKVDDLIKKKDLNKENIVSAYYLKAKYYFNKKEYTKEFNCLLNAHNYYFELEKKKFIPSLKYWFEYLPKFSNLNFEKNSNLNNNFKNFKPIFIVGLPRSGSTILEKILASGNNNIVSGEETGIINNIIKKKLITDGNIKANDIALLNEIINNYSTRNIINKKKDLFTDKSLENFFFINLILYIFPNAKIIHCKRNVQSSIVSIIKNNLKDLSWAHKLDHIYKYISIYSKTINFYKIKFPFSIFEVNLEDIIKNPEVELKKVFNYCELSWHPKCLDFYKKDNITSKTASNIQIRKPIDAQVKNYDLYKIFLDNMKESS